jgi:hypothetical protein
MPVALSTPHPRAAGNAPAGLLLPCASAITIYPSLSGCFGVSLRARARSTERRPFTALADRFNAFPIEIEERPAARIFRSKLSSASVQMFFWSRTILGRALAMRAAVSVHNVTLELNGALVRRRGLKSSFTANRICLISCAERSRLLREATMKDQRADSGSCLSKATIRE